ncbi:hypothetical protein MKW92_042479 [Papaver armeniacum]|nr:hypothetical protein MKW92_042479 [Papaver armeniacum]
MVSIQSCNGGTGLSFFGEDEIFCDILSRLPVKSLMRFKSVCTDWQLLIEKDSNFINLQLTHSKSDVNRTSLLVLPLHKPQCVGAETRIMLVSGDEEEEKYENRSSSSGSVLPHDLMLSCRNIIYTDFSITFGVEMLKPVNGLVCFANLLSGSVLIYNPSTRQRTCWIKTNIQIEKEEYLRESKVAVREDTYYHETKEWSPYYGFGFDPMTKEHKVVCVNKLTIRTRSIYSAGCSFDFICEVLTVGENRWRKIDEDLRWFRGGISVYVNGYIYWMGCQSYYQPNDILGFSVGSEKFDRVIKIPNFMLDLWCYKKNKRVSTLVVFELVVIDGHLSIIDREGDRWINLWIYNENDGNGGDCNWTKQEMAMPYVWDGTGCLALEHIAGTDKIMVKGTPKPPELEYCFYYNRKNKEYCRKQVEFIRSTKASSSPYCSRCPDLGYKVTSFFQTLLPVQYIN